MTDVGPRSMRFGRTQRLQPVRRLTLDEVDRLGFSGPLVLSERQVRWLFGAWRRTGSFVVLRHPNLIEMQCTRAQLAEQGIDVDEPRRR
jgi:hypothetical protein